MAQAGEFTHVSVAPLVLLYPPKIELKGVPKCSMMFLFFWRVGRNPTDRLAGRPQA